MKAALAFLGETAPEPDAPDWRTARRGAATDATLHLPLAARSTWFHVHLSTFDGVSPAQLADRAAVLDEPAMEPAKVTCTEIGPLAGALYGQDRAVEARRLWRSHCGARQALLADGGFDAARLNETSPFAWQFMGEGGLDLRLEPSRRARGARTSASRCSPPRPCRSVGSLRSSRSSWGLAPTGSPGPPTTVMAGRPHGLPHG